jgi:hypothetical protein
MLESGTDPKDWHELATGRRWGHAREARARDVAKRRMEMARADWQSMHQVALRGQEPRSWATEQGWDDERIEAAIRLASPGKKSPVIQKQGKPDPAYKDPRALEANAAALLEAIQDGITVEEIRTSPDSHWTAADIEVLLNRLLEDGRLVERDGRFFKVKR